MTQVKLSDFESARLLDVVTIIEDDDCLDRYFINGVRIRTKTELNEHIRLV